MKRTIPSIPQMYRNLRRWTEIISILSKYGLADWLSRTNIEFAKDQLSQVEGKSIARATTSARIRMALTELGPTFIKIGQILSTRADLIGVELAEELSLLQSNTPSDSFDEIRDIIEEELGCELNSAFQAFDEVPMASASIGQVHGARTRDGLDVVVKVQHAGIEKKIETDLDILYGLAQLAERLEEFKRYQPVQLAHEIGRTMRRELDFEREHRNLIQFRALFDRNRFLRIPEPISELCSRRVLTMGRLRGYKIDELHVSNFSCDERNEIARQGARVYLDMIFDHGFYHADPHPGNILLIDKRTIGLLDFGMVGRISEGLREDIEGMLMAIVNHDVPMLVALVQRIGKCPQDLNERALARDIADFVGQYATLKTSEFDVGSALNDFITIVRDYQISLPSEVSLLIKVLVTLEGTGRKLDPQFSLMEIMRPHQRMLLLKRMSPTRQLRKARFFYMQLEQLAERLPQRLNNILEQIQTGRFDIHLDHRRLGPSVNRLVVGMITSALFLGSSLMLSYKVPPLWFPEQGPWGLHDLSVLGVGGCMISFLIGFRLLWAIRKSGNLDQQE